MILKIPIRLTGFYPFLLKIKWYSIRLSLFKKILAIPMLHVVIMMFQDW